jgi:hypothetical protein
MIGNSKNPGFVRVCEYFFQISIKCYQIPNKFPKESPVSPAVVRCPPLNWFTVARGVGSWSRNMAGYKLLHIYCSCCLGSWRVGNLLFVFHLWGGEKDHCLVRYAIKHLPCTQSVQYLGCIYLCLCICMCLVVTKNTVQAPYPQNITVQIQDQTEW